MGGMGGRSLNKLLFLWKAFWRPTSRFSIGTLLIIGFISGVLYWGGFNWAIEASNTEDESVHYNNASGVRAICSDCHVPKAWHYKMIRKIRATSELYHKILGTVDTAEKFEAKRLELAQRVWKTMKETDSRECRNCHLMTAMALTNQSRRARNQHDNSIIGVEDGDTCIDCHKGIAHKAVHLDLEEEAEEGDEIFEF
jgi:cytochrome c-type protein NapC